MNFNFRLSEPALRLLLGFLLTIIVLDSKIGRGHIERPLHQPVNGGMVNTR
ncbi:hypothetical protein [Phormidesmis sp. 146-33]